MQLAMAVAVRLGLERGADLAPQLSDELGDIARELGTTAARQRDGGGPRGLGEVVHVDPVARRRLRCGTATQLGLYDRRFLCLPVRSRTRCTQAP